jgi:hypothetical protein
MHTPITIAMIVFVMAFLLGVRAALSRRNGHTAASLIVAALSPGVTKAARTVS